MYDPDIEITDPDGDYRIISTPDEEYGYALVYERHRFPVWGDDVGEIVSLLDAFTNRREELEPQDTPTGDFGVMTNTDGEKRPFFATDSGHRFPTQETDIPHFRNLFNDLAEQMQITATA